MIWLHSCVNVIFFFLLKGIVLAMAVFGLSGQVCSDASVDEQAERSVALFNSCCVHMSNNLDVFSVWLRSGLEILGHSDLTGTWLLLLFLLSHDFCLFLPRAL